MSELAERGVSVRFAAELPFKSEEELAPAESVLIEALRASDDERLIPSLATALRHPRFRSALPLLVEKLASVKTTSAASALAHAITTMGLEGHEAEVAQALPAVRSRMVRSGLEHALRKSGYAPPEPRAEDEPVLGPRARLVEGVMLVAMGIGCLGGTGWLYLHDGFTQAVAGLGVLQGLTFIVFGVALLRRAPWSVGAYFAWCAASIGFQYGFQVTYRPLSQPVFWAGEAGLVMALVALGSYYWDAFHPEEGER